MSTANIAILKVMLVSMSSHNLHTVQSPDTHALMHAFTFTWSSVILSWIASLVVLAPLFRWHYQCCP